MEGNSRLGNRHQKGSDKMKDLLRKLKSRKLWLAIAGVATNGQDRPLEDQKIASITVDTHGETYPEPKKLQDPYGRF